MLRLRIAAALLLLAPAALAACGGSDSDDADAAATETDAGAEATGTPRNVGLDQPVAPDRPLPSPTPLPDDAPIIQVVAGASTFTPTRAEFADLPTVTITADGRQYTGVTLAELARRVSAPAEAVVTIQGTRSDNLRYGAVRYALAEVGAATVVFIDESGYARFASAAIPAEQWLHTLAGIAFQ